MTIWTPDLSHRTGPKYRAIADAIAADVADGTLVPGERLPPQRSLAWTLGVTVGTISRGYAEAEKKGLVKGTVGSGTYVLPAPSRTQYAIAAEPQSGVIDMSMAVPAPGGESACFAETLRRLGEDPNIGALLEPPSSTPRYREAGAAWFARTGIAVSPDRVVTTAGAQHGIVVTLAALTQAGDRVATEFLTYNGVKPVAAMLGITLEGLPIDEHGLCPDAFEAACKRGGLKALYCIPSGHNPTTATMPQGRREAIAEIALRHGVAVVEDDIFTSLMPEAPPPIFHLVGDLGYCLTSLSKAVAPGLRIGFTTGPANMIDRLRLGVRSTCWAATPTTAEIAARWIADGTAEIVQNSRMAETAARLEIVQDILGDQSMVTTPGHVYVWMHLPEPWRANDFVAEAARRDIRITSSEAFAVGRSDAPHAVRICYGLPPTRAALVSGLKTLAEILSAPPSSGPPII
jgi:DNA-binding transcriptional MocR family regulator